MKKTLLVSLSFFLCLFVMAQTNGIRYCELELNINAKHDKYTTDLGDTSSLSIGDKKLNEEINLLYNNSKSLVSILNFMTKKGWKLFSINYDGYFNFHKHFYFIKVD